MWDWNDLQVEKYPGHKPLPFPYYQGAVVEKWSTGRADPRYSPTPRRLTRCSRNWFVSMGYFLYMLLMQEDWLKIGNAHRWVPGRRFWEPHHSVVEWDAVPDLHGTHDCSSLHVFDGYRGPETKMKAKLIYQWKHQGWAKGMWSVVVVLERGEVSTNSWLLDQSETFPSLQVPLKIKNRGLRFLWITIPGKRGKSIDAPPFGMNESSPHPELSVSLLSTGIVEIKVENRYISRPTIGRIVKQNIIDLLVVFLFTFSWFKVCLLGCLRVVYRSWSR